MNAVVTVIYTVAVQVYDHTKLVRVSVSRLFPTISSPLMRMECARLELNICIAFMQTLDLD